MKDNSGKRIGQDGRKCALRVGRARCVGWPKAVRLLNEGALDGLQAQVLSGVTESGKAFTLSDGIANVRRPSPALAHRPAPHSTAFLFPSARRGVKSALLDSSCCGGKKEESKKEVRFLLTSFCRPHSGRAKARDGFGTARKRCLSQQTIWADERLAVSPYHIRQCRFSESSAAR